MYSICGALLSETTFYNEISPLVDIEAPKSFLAKFDPRSFNSIIILEDLTNKVDCFPDHKTPINQARAKGQLEQLAKLHSRFLNAPELKTSLAKLGTWPELLIRNKEFGIDVGSNRGFLAAKDVIPPAIYKRYEQVWPLSVASAERHNQLPQTFVHNDVHLRNWYCLADNAMGLADWQCATLGHWSRDLAYSIVTGCTVENRRLWEKELIQFYLEKMAEGGATGITFDEAWDNYRQQMMTVLTWWTITLTPAPGMVQEMQPKDATLEFIRRIATAMEDLDTMDIV